MRIFLPLTDEHNITDWAKLSPLSVCPPSFLLLHRPCKSLRPPLPRSIRPRMRYYAWRASDHSHVTSARTGEFLDNALLVTLTQLISDVIHFLSPFYSQCGRGGHMWIPPVGTDRWGLTALKGESPLNLFRLACVFLASKFILEIVTG